MDFVRMSAAYSLLNIYFIYFFICFFCSRIHTHTHTHTHTRARAHKRFKSNR